MYLVDVDNTTMKSRNQPSPHGVFSLIGEKRCLPDMALMSIQSQSDNCYKESNLAL
jgi:hypothetical protein